MALAHFLHFAPAASDGVARVVLAWLQAHDMRPDAVFARRVVRTRADILTCGVAAGSHVVTWEPDGVQAALVQLPDGTTVYAVVYTAARATLVRCVPSLAFGVRESHGDVTRPAMVLRGVLAMRRRPGGAYGMTTSTLRADTLAGITLSSSVPRWDGVPWDFVFAARECLYWRVSLRDVHAEQRMSMARALTAGEPGTGGLPSAILEPAAGLDVVYVPFLMPDAAWAVTRDVGPALLGTQLVGVLCVPLTASGQACVVTSDAYTYAWAMDRIAASADAVLLQHQA